MLIDYNALIASVNCTNVNDVRMALWGVYVDGNTIVSTDGHIMYIHEDNDLVVCDDILNCIIPVDAILKFKKQVGKVDCKYIQLNKIDGQCVLVHKEFELPFYPICTKYPDYKRSIPRVLNSTEFAQHELQLNLDFIGSINKVRKALKLKSHPVMSFTQSSGGAVVYTWDNYTNVKVILMPMKR